MSIEELSKLIALVVGAGGVGGALQAIGGGVKAARSGRAEAEKTRNQDLAKQRDDAYQRQLVEQGRADKAETEAELHRRARQNLSDYASILRRLLIEAGYPEDRLPPWPNLNQ